MRHIFIINPVAGNKPQKENFYSEILDICRKSDIDPLVFISEYPGYEKEMTEKICALFPNEFLRFYSVGGSGTLVNIISGIKDFTRTEVACYPTGLSNDILKSYGDTAGEFKSLENLINGRVDYLDVIDVNGYKTLNFTNIGLGNSCFNDSLLFKLMGSLRAALNYGVGIFWDILRNKCYHYNIMIDGKNYSGKYAIFTCFNGVCMGSSIMPLKDPRPNDGVLNCLMVHKMSGFAQLRTLADFKKSRLDRCSEKITLVKGTNIAVSRRDRKKIVINCDGECVRTANALIRLTGEKLKFVVPQTAKLLEPTDLDPYTDE